MSLGRARWNLTLPQGLRSPQPILHPVVCVSERQKPTGGDVKNKSLTPSDFNGSVQGAKGDIGPQGPKGDNGTNGTNGTDATVNGVAAGGDLTAAIRTP